jgi:hypothetical protein
VFVQKPPDLIVPQGGTAVLSVTTTGTLPIGYRWRRGFLTVGQQEVIYSHTSFLILTNVQTIDAGSYTVVATNEAFYLPGVLSPAGTLTVVPDTDQDGLPDDWETNNGLNPDNAGDALLDPDGDGLTNEEEYIAGTDHLDAASYLKVDQVSAAEAVAIEFIAVSNKTYTVQFTDNLNSGLWIKLSDVAHQTVTRTEILLDRSPGPNRYYRLVTPRQP